MIFHSDSAHQYMDIQVALDCAMNGGILNPTIKNTDSNRKVKIICTNPDISYADQHALPRLTVGALAECVKALYNASTSKELEIDYHGKPYETIFKIAEQRLLNNEGKKNGDEFYIIGDSLQSDILGGNLNGWTSVLSLTGKVKHADELKEFDAKYQPKMVFKDAFEAVKAIVG